MEYVVRRAEDTIQADPTNPLFPPIDDRMEFPAVDAMDVVEDDAACPAAAAAATSEGAPDSIDGMKPIYSAGMSDCSNVAVVLMGAFFAWALIL